MGYYYIKARYDPPTQSCSIENAATLKHIYLAASADKSK